jgi:hypothetical protein
VAELNQEMCDAKGADPTGAVAGLEHGQSIGYRSDAVWKRMAFTLPSAISNGTETKKASDGRIQRSEISIHLSNNSNKRHARAWLICTVGPKISKRGRRKGALRFLT